MKSREELEKIEDKGNVVLKRKLLIDPMYPQDGIKPKLIFARISQRFSFKDAHLELASDKRKDAIIQFAKTVFIPDEPLSKSLDLELDEEIERVLGYIIQDNLSVLLISDLTDEIVAFRVTHIANKDDKRISEGLQNEKMRSISKFLAHKDDEMNAFTMFGVDKTVHFLMLGVDQRFRKQGIASKIMEAAIAFYSEIGLDPVVFKGEGTSNFSKAIYEKFGFETIHEFPYEDYKVNNEVVFKNTGIHKSTKVYVKKV